MARKLDPKIAEVLKDHGFGPEACWDCHGTWVVYHRVLEAIAAKSGIEFAQPHIIEAHAEKGIASLCVTGSLGDKTEWSIGEASPKNNKNAYCWAMAEKRGKDRVVLKLIGLHGLAYSEEEADDFKSNIAKNLPEAGSRDITDGIGTQAADPPNLDLMTPWNEVEAEFSDPKEYLQALSEKLESVGAYWPANEGVVEFIGKTFQDKGLKAQARAVFKFGRDAWAQSPDNPKNKINDPAQQQPLEGSDKPTGAPF